MAPAEEIIEDEDEVSFAPAPSPEEARARLAALRGKPLDAPSRLATAVDEKVLEMTSPAEVAAVKQAMAAPAVSVQLPANMAARLLALLSDDKPAPKAEPQKPAKAAKADKPLFKPVKVRITTRVDADVLEAFKALGPGWQTRMNDVLREHMPTS